MSDLIKAQNLPQFNWYTHWTSLGANCTPDNLIKEGLKQPNCIKISFKKGAQEITGQSCLTRLDLVLITFMRSRSPISCQRF
jgi:hypothetical protein